MKKVLFSLFAAACVLPIGSAFAQSHSVGGSRPDVTASSTIFTPGVQASSIVSDVTAFSVGLDVTAFSAPVLPVIDVQAS